MMIHAFAKVGTLLSLLVIVAAASPASAQQDVITIKRGTFVFLERTQQGTLDFAGTQGFRIRAGVNLFDGFFPVIDACRFGECRPGTVLEIFARWTGDDVNGGVQVRGVTYEIGGLVADAGVSVTFTSSVVLPPLAEGPLLLSAPFDFSGGLSIFEGEIPRRTFAGGGIMTLTLVPHPFEVGAWWIEQVVFAFRPLPRRE